MRKGQKGLGSLYERPRSPYWWCTYGVDGKRVRESTGETDRVQALAYLRKQLTKADKGLLRRPGHAMFEDLAAGLIGHYRRNKRKSLDRAELSLTHLGRHLGHLRADQIGTSEARRYTDRRLDEGAAHGTINRELSALKKALRIAHADGLISELPAVEMLAERNVRKGFLSDAGYVALRAALPPRLRPLLDAAYVTGWRRGELLSRRWRHLDLQRDAEGQIVGGTLRLEPGETKNDRGREFPLVGPLLTAIVEQEKQKRETERRTGRLVEALFFDYVTGKAIRDFRGAWTEATQRAGCPALLFHDLRRSAARNLIRAGVSEREAMELLGHQTRSIFDRYAIVDDEMIRGAGDRVAAFFSESESESERQVVPIDEAR